MVPVAGVTAVSLRAVRYAQTLPLPDTHALFIASDREDAARMKSDWERHRVDMPLEVIGATHRDLGRPLLTQIRKITTDPEAVAVVVMPELVVRGIDRLLHNQRALYLKRLLIFEPQVILTSVPYQLL